MLGYGLSKLVFLLNQTKTAVTNCLDNGYVDVLFITVSVL